MFLSVLFGQFILIFVIFDSLDSRHVQHNTNSSQSSSTESFQSDADDDNSGFIWEKSGYFEGDVMLPENSKNPLRNVMIDKVKYWPNATVPFIVKPFEFNRNQLNIILEAMEEFHRRTCVRFRPYRSDDTNWIEITSYKKGELHMDLNVGLRKRFTIISHKGCFSFVGMQKKGSQPLNLDINGCVTKGVVVHEML